MYNFNHLYYFYITAKSSSVTIAAGRLRISQPSLSSQLKVLEGALNLKLFQKSGRHIELTQAGQIIYGYCRRMFEVSEEMTEALLRKVPTSSRRILIGVSDEVDRPFVVEIISLFLKKQPVSQRPKVSVVAGTHIQLVERLRFGEIDVMVSELAMTDPDLMNLSSVEVPVALVCSRKWKMKTNVRGLNATDSIEKIIGGDFAQWVMPSAKFKLRTEIDQFFEKNQLKGRTVFESDVIASLVRSVIDQTGLAFLPLLYIGREIREKSVRILGPRAGFWKYRVWLVCNSRQSNDALIESFSQSFDEVCKVFIKKLPKQF
jgi:LysR family transcriptional regulator, transcriptional activator of nhaA